MKLDGNNPVDREEAQYRQLVRHVREAAGSKIPPGSTILVVSKGDEELLRMNGCRAWHFPQDENGNYAGHYPADSAAAIEQLESLRGRGGDFLLFPATAFWWLADYADFGRHLEKHYQRVRDDARCIIYQLAVPSEPLPVPPPELIFLVSGQYKAGAFLEDGKRAFASLVGILKKNSIDISVCDAVLDFGCGCGRVARYLCGIKKTGVYGADYNPSLIQWCQQNLRHGSFEQNNLAPPLSFPSSRFDLVYVLSVFTHLPESLQQAWMTEFGRIVRPGGHLLFTVHGDAYFGLLDAGERNLFRRGELVVRDGADQSGPPETAAGTNSYAVFHPHRYVVEKLARGWQQIDFLRQAGLNGEQAGYLFQKTG